jgi:thymidylate synthase (FAD)
MERMNRKQEILDHGYIEMVECMGSDERIIEAARMSTQAGFKGWPGDERLLSYLWRNQHSSPFEMCEAVFEIKAPIFVARQWMRHRTQSYNEASARYTELCTEDYLPTVERLLNVDTENKQAQGTGAELGAWDAEVFRRDMAQQYENAGLLYGEMLEAGVPKELARCVLPVARYTVFRAKANLLNWLKFVRLRADSHAQYEIRVYADALEDMLAEKFPRTLALFREHG